MSNSVNILSLNSEDAKKFFLKNESYCNLTLPSYFYFENLLKGLDDYLSNRDLSNLTKKSKVGQKNYLLYANKDGNLSWRPFQLINPLLYVDLVHCITQLDNWSKLQERFQEFQSNTNICCMSIPVQSAGKKSNTAEQILTWWEGIEQESIALALEYDYLFDTDISDCYGSIYTHSIAWAVVGKQYAKENRSENNLGNYLDRKIQNMQDGQTNGIPQGSILMDFIAEIVLGYIDKLLSKELECKKIYNYKILRYRDDYRIFVKKYDDGVEILRILSKIMIPFGFKLNSSKTKSGQDIITQSIKSDKLEWMKYKMSDYSSFQKRLLLIRQHSIKFPNSGSVSKSLNKFDKKLEKYLQKKNIVDCRQLISITVDIAKNNPRMVPVCCSIISKLIHNESFDFAKSVFEKLIKVPNSGLAQIWLQRIFKNSFSDFDFDEQLCILPSNPCFLLWDNSWITSKAVHEIFKNNPIFIQEEFDKIKDIIENKEVDDFGYGAYC